MKKTITKIGIVMLLAVTATTFNSCKKKTTPGCTTATATNFNSSADTDDGSCKYNGSLVFWWKQPFQDSCASNGVTAVKVYADGVFQGTLAVASQFWNSAPSCGANATVTINEDLGSNKTKNVSISYAYTIGGTDYPISGSTTTFEANTCISYEKQW